MTPLQIAALVYVAGILPAIVICGWYNARHDIRNDVPAICNGLAWPLLFVVLCVVVPLVYATGRVFEQPAKLGAWLYRHYGQPEWSERRRAKR